MSAAECSNSSLYLQLLLRNNENWNQQCVNRRGRERERKEGKMSTIYSYVWVPVHWSIGNSSSLASGLSSILDLVQLNWADLVVARPRRQSQWQSQQYLSIQKEKTNQILLLLLQQIADSKCCALWIVAPRHPSAQTMQTGKQLAAFILLRA